jgi:glycosyltransferase involved in cell wall biosynthesis
MAERDLDSYRRAADFLNITNVDLVCLQHEFGIFGGSAGSHILALLRELRMPVVTTLHTVLREPDAQQHKVMKELGELSDRLVVMSERGRGFLQDVYAIPAEKIDLIPHGIPDVPFVDPNFYKDRFGVEGKLVLLTFGLLSPSKGIPRSYTCCWERPILTWCATKEKPTGSCCSGSFANEASNKM